MHASGHNAGLDFSALDRGADGTHATNKIDGPEMMLMAAARRRAALQAHAERCPVKRRFHIVRRQRIAREKDIDVAISDEPSQIFVGSSVNDGGACHDAGFSLFLFNAAQELGNRTDKCGFGFFRGRVRRHEFEKRPITRTLERHHFHAVMPHHEIISPSHLRESNRLAAAGSGINTNA